MTQEKRKYQIYAERLSGITHHVRSIYTERLSGITHHVRSMSKDWKV